MEGLWKVPPADQWYVVGYITADGNLSSDGRHINITSKDIDHLLKIRKVLRLNNKLTLKARCTGGEKKYGVLQFGSVHYYRQLMAIGLIPRKSLALTELFVPEEHFKDFLRGVIDGDGSIMNWVHPQNNAEQWGLRIFSAAPLFAKWVKIEIESQFHVKGTVVINKTKPPYHPMYIIKFGKMAAKVILKECYYGNAIALDRKALLAKQCIESYTGWTRSRTVQ